MKAKKIIRYIAKRFIHILPRPLVFKLYFFWRHGYWPQMNTPRTLIEKILWLMMWDKNPLRSEIVDRIKVRKFVHERTPDCVFPEHFWVGNTLTAEIWNSLPTKFVLKANHGSHMTSVIDKKKNSYDEVIKKAELWLTQDYSQQCGEWVYKDVPRVLIVEEKLEVDNKVPPDWKFFCANGKVFLVVMNSDRTENSKIDTFFYPDFTRVNDLKMSYPTKVDSAVPKPPCFDDALNMAERISAPFDFIRVDFYLIGNSVYFGELTCFPGAGMENVKPTRYDFEFGSKIKLDKSYMIDTPRPVWEEFTKLT